MKSYFIDFYILQVNLFILFLAHFDKKKYTKRESEALMYTYTCDLKKQLPSSSLGSPYLTNLYYIREQEEDAWTFNLHAHADTLEISYLFKGETKLYIDGKLYDVQAGDLIIKNPSVLHAEKSSVANSIEEICLNIKGLKLEGMEENYLLSNDSWPIIPAGRHRKIIDSIFREMLNEILKNPSPSINHVNSLLSSALQIITYKTEGHRLITANKRENAIREIRKYIDNHFKEDLSLNSLAEIFHISVFHLSRQFKKYTGYTVNHYIVSCRLGEAQIRLIFGKDSIADIAADCGYPSLSYFYTKFKKKIGCTPSEYRRRYS